MTVWRSPAVEGPPSRYDIMRHRKARRIESMQGNAQERAVAERNHFGEAAVDLGHAGQLAQAIGQALR